MAQTLELISLLVLDYDQAVEFYVGALGFRLIEDVEVPDEGKRWVVVGPGDGHGCRILLARASTPEQVARVGDQTGGRVFLFIYTDDFERNYRAYTTRGVEFVSPPRDMPYGRVAVFRDLYGNLWDLIQRRGDAV